MSLQVFSSHPTIHAAETVRGWIGKHASHLMDKHHQPSFLAVMLNQQMKLKFIPTPMKITKNAMRAQNVKQVNTLPKLVKLPVNEPVVHIMHQRSRNNTWAEELSQHSRIKGPWDKQGVI